MTGSWLTLSDVARRISEVTGNAVSLEDVIELGADDGPLKVLFMHGYWSVSEESVTAYLAEHVDKPLVSRDPANPAEAEMTVTDDALYRREQGT